MTIFDTAALWSPVKERAILELIREDDDSDVESESEEGRGWEGVRLAGESFAQDSTGEGGPADWEDEVDVDNATAQDAEWERRFLAKTSPSLGANLTTLNLAFSPIALKSLRSLLLHDHPSRPLPALPHLTVLQLAATPNLPFSQPFFDILKPLVQLRQLSVAGKLVDGPTAVPTPVLLSRLAAATSTLVVIDLSYLPLGAEQLDRLIGELDWDARWPHLRRLGVRMGAKAEERESRRKALWAAIALRGREKPRPWVDIIT
ncbi:hypothetical protein RQP46_008631 [Phenoliferia psychrophenolica]